MLASVALAHVALGLAAACALARAGMMTSLMPSESGGCESAARNQHSSSSSGELSARCRGKFHLFLRKRFVIGFLRELQSSECLQLLPLRTHSLSRWQKLPRQTYYADPGPNVSVFQGKTRNSLIQCQHFDNDWGVTALPRRGILKSQNAAKLGWRLSAGWKTAQLKG